METKQLNVVISLPAHTMLHAMAFADGEKVADRLERLILADARTVVESWNSVLDLKQPEQVEPVTQTPPEMKVYPKLRLEPWDEEETPISYQSYNWKTVTDAANTVFAYLYGKGKTAPRHVKRATGLSQKPLNAAATLLEQNGYLVRYGINGSSTWEARA